MRIEIDYDRCTGHGICESLAADIFLLDDDGVMHLNDGVPLGARRGVVEEAVRQCPAQALDIVD